jgi:hypothetical protein
MAKPASVAAIKGQKRFRRERPREGSGLRHVYDLLLTGLPLRTRGLYGPRRFGVCKEQLCNFYGMELVTPKRGYIQCIGIWDGSELVPLHKLDYAGD